MTGTPNSLAVRDTAALELRAGQTMWTRDQHAALVAMGIPAKATSAELGVFLHQCQRLRLDPFTKQIYLIYRKVKEGDRWIEKPTTQIGIDGFRVTRDRIAAERGVAVEYQDTTWYASDGQAYDVWLWDEPPAACKFTVLVDGRRFPSVLRFNEYCQRNRDGDRTGRWRDGFAHQIEKCAEADALRRAFPNDLSGVILEDAAPLDDPDAPSRLPQDRPRVTAEQARQRSPQTVTATVVTPDPSPAGTETTPHSAPSAAPSADVPPAGEAHRKPQQASGGQVGLIRKKFTELYPGEETPGDRAQRLIQTALLAGLEIDTLGTTIGSTNDLTAEQAARVRLALDKVKTAAQLEALIASGEVPGAE